MDILYYMAVHALNPSTQAGGISVGWRPAWSTHREFQDFQNYRERDPVSKEKKNIWFILGLIGTNINQYQFSEAYVPLTVEFFFLK